MARLMILFFFFRLLSLLAGRPLGRKKDLFSPCACSNDFSLLHTLVNKYFTLSSWVLFVRLSLFFPNYFNCDDFKRG